MVRALFLLTLLPLLVTRGRCDGTGSHKYNPNWSEEEIAAAKYLEIVDKESSEQCYKNAIISWNYASDITEANQQAVLEADAELAEYLKARWKNITKIPYKSFKDENLKRQFAFMSVLGKAALPAKKFKKYNQLKSDMEVIYSTRKICEFRNQEKCGLSLEPDLVDILSKSRDEEQLKYVWTEWREKTGKTLRNQYKEMIKLNNEAARLNNFSTPVEALFHDFHSDTIREDIEYTFNQLKPLYEQLHAYVRRHLRKFYGEDKISKDGPIPAHLLGNMWAQTWGHILDIMQPYPGKVSVDVTPQMNEQGYTPLKMFQISDEFFTSLGLIPMPPTFWEESIIEKQAAKEMVCHASAWDFCNGKDFRIKQCTLINMEYLITVHHEMGHVQYFLQFKDQPKVFRDGANPAFHEAIGDVMALSVSTPKHLKEIKLLNKVEDNYETDINFLFSVALNKIAFLPFANVMGNFRWSVFNEDISMDDMNCHWWKLREKYQGLKPPVLRTEDDFDPGAKYHILLNGRYITYFVSFVIQFQFHKALCLAANQYDPNNPNKPLHKCDIYRSKEAGTLLSNTLKLGSSKPWPDAMETLTGQRKMDASALREYFSPLEQWLTEQNRKSGEYIGWKQDGIYCVKERSDGDSGKGENSKDDSSAPSSSILVITTVLMAMYWL